jgi:hypothetical protein
MPKKSSVPVSIGKGLAHFQSFVDDVLTIGFKKLKGLESKNKYAKKPKTYGQKAVYYSKKTAGFFGEIGESFFKNYENLKVKKKDKSYTKKK